MWKKTIFHFSFISCCVSHFRHSWTELSSTSVRLAECKNRWLHTSWRRLSTEDRVLVLRHWRSSRGYRGTSRPRRLPVRGRWQARQGDDSRWCGSDADRLWGGRTHLLLMILILNLSITLKLCKVEWKTANHWYGAGVTNEEQTEINSME